MQRRICFSKDFEANQSRFPHLQLYWVHQKMFGSFLNFIRSRLITFHPIYVIYISVKLCFAIVRNTSRSQFAQMRRMILNDGMTLGDTQSKRLD